MLFSIRNKLILIYGLLLIIPLLLVNYFAVENIRQSVFQEVQINGLKSANMIANLSKESIQDQAVLKRRIKEYQPAMGGRVLILNRDMVVLADSYNLLEDQVVSNQEVRGALGGEEKLGLYQDYNHVMQVAVPIYQTREGARRVEGAVLIATAVTSQYEQVEDFRRQLTTISFGAAVLGFIVALGVSGKMAAPIQALSQAAVRIGQGKLGETVPVRSRDELGNLAQRFNQMSLQLAEIDQGRTEFISAVSHELKTPLASMRALIDSLLYGEEDIRVYQEYLGDMNSEIDRLSRLIQSLLNMTRLQEQGLRKEWIAIESPLEEAVKILRPLANQMGVHLTTKIPPGWMVYCDQDRLREALINLIDNGIKYRDHGKKVQEVMVALEVEKEFLRLSVTDNGIGLTPKEQERIFERFYRAEASRSRETGGAGIGMALVKGIIEAHQWTIQIKSQERKGTKISILIPKGSFKVSS